MAHPMGNLSVNHYTKISVFPDGAEITYALDFGESPTYRLLREWGFDPAKWKSIDANNVKDRAEAAMREWMADLEARPGRLVLERCEVALREGDDRLSAMRVMAKMRVEGASGELKFEDRNFADRAGWKEIAIGATGGAQIVEASQRDGDRSRELTIFPAGANPPNDLRARVKWNARAGAGVVAKIAPIDQPAPVSAPPETTPSSAAPPQDFLKRVLSQGELGFWLMLACIGAAMGLGAIHALSPGHGKTIVAAYLVGSRGTMGHAAFLGAMVTFTHTISVFALGIATLFLSKYFVPERLTHWLEAISGVAIVAVGVWLLYKRVRALKAMGHDHDHHHEHPHHDHDHAHDDHHHDHDHEHAHHTHQHVPEGEVTIGNLIALGASGGLVPCPSAMVLLLFAISVGRVGLGLVLLVAFSLGLAGVLTAIGMLVLYAKNWLPDPKKTSRHPLFKFVPVASAAAIVTIGIVMTSVSLGWVPRGFGG